MTTLFNEQNRIAGKLLYLLTLLLPFTAYTQINTSSLDNPNDAVTYCAASTIWNGTSWSNGEPETGKDAIFTADFTFTTGTFNACSVNVINGAHVNFASDTNAIIVHNIHVAANAELSFESSANLIQTEGSQNSGSVTIKRNSSEIVKDAFTLWSSPVSGQMLQSFSPLTLSNRFYTYSTANNIYATVTSPATTAFTTSKSYLIRTEENHPLTPTVWEGRFTGTPNTGDITVGLDYVSENQSYNAIGNPYPSPLSIQKFFDANEQAINGTLWLWRKTSDPSKSSYATVTRLGYQSNTATDPENSTIQDPYSLHEEGILNTAQGFLVKASSASQNVVFDNSMRLPLSSDVFFRTASEADDQPEKSRFWLNVTSEHIFSQVLIGYTNQTTEEFDLGYDGEFILDGKTTLYSFAGTKKLAIQALPEFEDNDIVTLGFKTETAGTFTFALDHKDGVFAQGQSIYIIDAVSNTVHDITEAGYTFTSEAGTFDNRFKVVYNESTAGIETPVQDKKDVIVFSNNHTVHLQSSEEIASVAIYDLTGRMIFAQDNINNTSFTSAYINATAPVIVKLAMNNGTIVSKKIVVQ
ncbi:MAG: hypothetical protein DI539_19285 [Flavobacterium psychrophilum]|nr:MAG: hypothetical protein DI539_19285 [Flavobacterium psychrophilum]